MLSFQGKLKQAFFSTHCNRDVMVVNRKIILQQGAQNDVSILEL